MAEAQGDHEAGARAGPAAWIAAARDLVERGQRELWLYHPEEAFWIRGLRSTTQLIALTARGFVSDELLLRASALTYITALSIIPMLAVAFAILDIVGGNAAIVDFAIAQLTTVAPEVRDTVYGYVDNLDFARFGTVGGALVFGTAIFALRHLEATLNNIWGVARHRSWARRLSDYLTVMVVAPISTAVAVSLGTTLQNEAVVQRLLDYPVFAQLYGLGLTQLPMVVLFLGFSFLYWFFPNTDVKLRAAALGGLVAAVLFTAARAVYVQFQVGASTYETVFGALSAVPLILAWLYACWAVVLLGAEVAYAAQNLHSARRELRAGEMAAADREIMALELAVAVARAFGAGGDPPTASVLADWLDEPLREVHRLLERLESAELLRSVKVGDAEDMAYAPARPLERLTVGDVLRAVREDPSGAAPLEHIRDERVGEAIQRLANAWSSVADETTIQSLVGSDPEPLEPA